MDITTLSQLPLTVLVILGAYWAVQRHNDEYAKKLVELIAQFSEKYTELINRATEERDEARQRWMERDRHLIGALVNNEKAMLENAQQNHALRNTLQPLIVWWQAEERRQAKRATRGTAESGDDANAAG